MGDSLETPPNGKRELALYQVHFYAILQELILDVMRVQEGDSSYFDGFGLGAGDDDEDEDEDADEDSESRAQ